MVTVPGLVVVATPVPLGSAAEVPLSVMIEEVLEVPAAIENVAVAATPFATVVAFSPKIRQVKTPVPVLQSTDFPAAVAVGPVATVRLLKSVVE